MTKFSDEKYLGQMYGIIVALIFPLSYGIIDIFRRKKLNFFSALGIFSILITGIVGVAGLDRNWIIVKETAIPLVFGIAVMVSQWMGKSLVRIFFNQILDLEKINHALRCRGKDEAFTRLMVKSSYALGGTFFISAILNFVLAIYILKGEPGTIEFNQSLGKMTAWSFPVITVPMMLMTGIIIWILFNNIKKQTHLDFHSFIRH